MERLRLFASFFAFSLAHTFDVVFICRKDLKDSRKALFGVNAVLKRHEVSWLAENLSFTVSSLPRNSDAVIDYAV